MNKIYFDLDGVMANFEKAIVQQCKMHYWDRTVDKFWHLIDTTPNFYYHLELLPEAYEMFHLVYDKHGPEVVEVLTGAPKPTNMLATACKDKENWFHDKVHAGIKVNTIEGGKNKYKFLEENPGAVLIDDYARNIKSWIEYGGVGILHTDPASTIEKLKLLKILE